MGGRRRALAAQRGEGYSHIAGDMVGAGNLSTCEYDRRVAVYTTYAGQQ